MTDDKPPVPVGAPGVPPTGGQSAETNPNPPAPPASMPPGAVKAEPMALPPIPLHPAPPSKTVNPGADAAGKKDLEPKDSFRELIETVVFVVVLVLMLKTFLAEAFVIPTGSMAVTLLGYHHKINCEQCGRPNLINASSEAEPAPGRLGDPVVNFRCENCRWVNVIRPVAP